MVEGGAVVWTFGLDDFAVRGVQGRRCMAPLMGNPCRSAILRSRSHGYRWGWSGPAV
jgi:hypothetical protein